MQELFRSRDEQNKCLGMSVLMFLTILGYNIMRGMKEAVLINLPGSGAAYIPLVKLYVVLPLSFFIGLLYLSFRKKYGTFYSYYLFTSIFLGYFLLFNFVIVPYTHYLHPSESWILSMQSDYPHIRFIFGIIGNWSGAIYYACGELWGTFTLLILFWQIANEMFNSEQATRIYPILSFVSSVALFMASFILKYLSSTDSALHVSTLIVASFGSLMLLSVYFIQHYLNDKPAHFIPPTKKKNKPPLADCLSTLSSNPHVLYLVLCIFIFSVLTNMFEVSVKEKISTIYPNQSGYLDFMSTFTGYKGLLCMITNVFNIRYLRRLGWFNIAMISPIVCIVAVNSFLLYSEHHHLFSSILAIDNLDYYAAWSGVFGIVAIYTAKYTFFDTTKEMALIPLNDNDRANGKAAVDGLGGRLGKSGYGAIHTVLCTLTGFDHMQDITFYLLQITVVLSILWLWVMFRLNHSYQKAVLNQQGQDDISLDNITTSDDETVETVVSTA